MDACTAEATNSDLLTRIHEKFMSIAMSAEYLRQDYTASDAVFGAALVKLKAARWLYEVCSCMHALLTDRTTPHPASLDTRRRARELFWQRVPADEIRVFRSDPRTGKKTGTGPDRHGLRTDFLRTGPAIRPV